MLIDVDVVCCARYELNMMTAAHKTTFEDLFKKKFYDIPNALYRGSLGFKTAAVGSEEQVFDNILAAKTVTEIPRASKNRRVEGPTGAAKWDVTSPENLALFKSREEEKSEKEAKKKEAEEKKKEKEKEREAKKKEKEEQIQEKRREREERKTQKEAAAAAKKAERAAKKADEEAKKVEKSKKTKEMKVDDPIPGPSNTRKSARSRK